MIRRFDRVTSTNDVARRWASEGAPHGAVVIALRQTAGRGRLGRTWQSPPGGNLYLSMVVYTGWPADKLGLVSLAAAVAVSEACGPGFGIKWPNDVLAPDGRKVAGILTEAEWERSTLRFLVVGIGVNLTVPVALSSASTLSETGAEVDRPVFEADLIRGLRQRLEASPEAVLSAWRARATTLGRSVSVGDVTGVAEDVDETGALRVRTADGAWATVTSGDLTFPLHADD